MVDHIEGADSRLVDTWDHRAVGTGTDLEDIHIADRTWDDPSER